MWVSGGTQVRLPSPLPPTLPTPLRNVLVVALCHLPYCLPAVFCNKTAGRQSPGRAASLQRKPTSAKPPACFCPKLPPVRDCVRKRTSQLTPRPACRSGVSPSVVRERLIRLRHLVQILPPLHGSTDTICCIHQLAGQPGLHRALTARP